MQDILSPCVAWGTASMPKVKKPAALGKKPIRVGNKIFIIMMAFVAAVAILTWVLQIGLLENFYAMINQDQMESACQEIESAVGDEEDLSAIANYHANSTGICIKIYRVLEDGSLVSVTDCSESFGCAIHNITNEDIMFLYTKAQTGASSYYHRYLQILPEHPDEEPADPEDSSNGGSVDEEASNPDETPNPNDPSSGKDDDIITPPVEDPNETLMETVSTDRLVMARVIGEDTKYFVLLDCAIAPVAPIASTLRRQLAVVTLIMVATAVVIGYAISRIVAAPMSSLNNKAKQLVKGDYTVDYTVEGYREVVELSETLNTAAEELGRIDRLQKELIGNVSHDLRTPLTMIVGYSEMMRDVPSEVTAENLQVIVDEAKRLNGLVTDLLEISRYQAGSVASNPVLFDLTQAIEETVNSYRHLKAAEGYRFVWHAGAPSQVYADRDHILRALCNLINNAINFAGEDKVVEIRLHSGSTAVRVEVVDHGPGISEEELGSIWTRYYRSDRTKGRRIGTGLGLSIVSHIMEENYATYGVESALGVGSCFWFELPHPAQSEEEI